MSLLYPKTTKKKRSKHISNTALKEYAICEVCGKNQATETHEIFNGSLRNKSIQYEAQVKICRTCHDSAIIKLLLKQIWQYELMKKHSWSMKDWREIFGKSYIKE